MQSYNVFGLMPSLKMADDVSRNLVALGESKAVISPQVFVREREKQRLMFVFIFRYSRKRSEQHGFPLVY